MPDRNNNDWHDVFISYAHDDLTTILPDIEWLIAKGYSVWFDANIHAGTDWVDELADAIDRSQFLFYFVSESSVASPHCQNEIAYATDANKLVVPIYISRLELTGGLKLSTSRTQAILRWQLSLDEYRQQLRSAFAQNGMAFDETVTKKRDSQKTIWHVPAIRNRFFQGRDTLFEQVTTSLRSSDPPVAVLAGLAGVGKSQIALEYAYRHKNEYELVAWIRAEEDSSLEADLVELAGKLKLARAFEPNSAVVLKELKEYLANRAGWLLVLDNAERPEVLSRYLPVEIKGHVIITSRLQNWGHHADRFSVDAFSLDEATRFVQSRLSKPDTDATRILVETLGRLPLALEEAAAYMEATGRTVSGYLKLFENHHRALLNEARPPDDYPQTLRAALTVSLQELEKEDADAARLLNLLAFVAPDDISITTIFANELKQMGDVPIEMIADRCVSALRKYSLVKVEEDSVSVHRLVQLVVRDRLSEIEFEENVTRAIEFMEAVFPKVRMMGTQASRCRRLLPHAVTLYSHAQNVEPAQKRMAMLLVRTGTFVSANSWDKDALDQLRQAYEIFSNMPDDYLARAYSCELYAGSLYGHGLLNEASQKFDESISFHNRAGNPKPQRELGIYAHMAWVDWCQGDFDRALRSAQSSLDVTEKGFGSADPQRIAALGIMCRIHMDCGRISAASGTLEDTINTVEKLGGFRLPLMCGVFMQMAHVMLSLGKPRRAQSWAEEALQVGKPAMSELHPLVATSRCVLGQIKLALGDLEAARSQFEPAVASARESGYMLNQHMVVAASFLAYTLIKLEKLDEARKIVQEDLVDIRSRIAGEFNYAEGMSLLVQGLFESKVGSTENGIELCLRGDRHISDRFGKQHSYRLDTLRLLAEVQWAGHKEGAARTSYLEGIEIAEACGLTGHPTLADYLLGLATIDSASGNKISADIARQQADELLAASIGPSSRQAQLR